MADFAAPLPVLEAPLLSQPTRMVDTIVAPSKTFADILRSAACWLPLVLVFLLTFGWAYTIDRTVGFAAVAQQQMEKNPNAEERMKNLPPEQRAHQLALTAQITRATTYGSGVFYIAFVALESLVLWASFNFGLGASTRYPQVFAVVVFSAIPRYLLWILSAGLLFAGVGTDNFDLRNPVGTNLGYYLTDSPKWMQTAGAFFDVLGFWALALLVLGMAIVARKRIAQSAVVVIGWWALILLIATAATAAFS